MSFANTLRTTSSQANAAEQKKSSDEMLRKEIAADNAVMDFMKIGKDKLAAKAATGRYSTFIKVPLVYHLGHETVDHPAYAAMVVWLDDLGIEHRLHSTNMSCYGACKAVTLDGMCTSDGYFLIEASWDK